MSSKQPGEPMIVDMTTNFLADPLGIDDVTPSLAWKLHSSQPNTVQVAYQLRAASERGLLEGGKVDLWDTGTVESNQQIDVPYAGAGLSSRQGVFWQVRVWTADDRVSAWSPIGSWEMGLIDRRDWSAEWIQDPASSVDRSERPMPIFAKHFSLDSLAEIVRARIYVSGLGLYEVRLNGVKVGEDFLTPSATKYRKRALYKTYDVTSQVQPGPNRLGLLVGNGLFNVPPKEGRYWEAVTWKEGVTGGEPIHLVGTPMVIAQLEVTYPDGRVERVASDPSWMVSDGPIEFSGYYGGEDYDARAWPSEWDQPSGDLSGWRSALAAESPPATLSAQFEPPIREAARLEPAAIENIGDDAYVFDFGTNFVGWPEIKARGPAGTRIAMYPGWYRDDVGRVSQDGMAGWTSGVEIVDHYTLGDEEEAAWHPRFSYHGFRYLEVRGLPNPPTAKTVTGVVLRAAASATGSFSSSSEMLNDIHRIVDRSRQGVMLGPTMPTDPNREKAGWQGDRGVGLSGGIHYYDFASYNQAAARDIADGQRVDGALPGIVPDPTDFWYVGDTNWTGVLLTQSYESHRLYGDAATLRRHYGAMRRYFEYLESREVDGIHPGGPMDEGYFGDWFYPGQDWQNPFDSSNPNFTPAAVTATWGYWRCAKAMAGIAGELGHGDEARRFAEKADAIARAFHRAFFDAGAHTYAHGSQAADALALDMGAPSVEERERVLERLLDRIRQAGDHLNLGMIGLPAAVRVLAAEGRSDVLYDVATQTTYPSYGYWLEHGATSIAEDWAWAGTGNVPDIGILGGIDPWFVRDLAGIRQAPEAVAFDRMIIAPAPVGSLTEVAVTLQTVRGEVASHWRRDAGGLTMRVFIPANASATVIVPLAGGRVRHAPAGATLISDDSIRATYQIGSGSWKFETKAASASQGVARSGA